MRRSTAVLAIIFICLISNERTKAQTDSLRLGIPIERALAQGQNHTFSINLDQDQFVQFVVDQHGIDVIVGIRNLTSNFRWRIRSRPGIPNVHWRLRTRLSRRDIHQA